MKKNRNIDKIMVYGDQKILRDHLDNSNVSYLLNNPKKRGSKQKVLDALIELWYVEKWEYTYKTLYE